MFRSRIGCQRSVFIWLALLLTATFSVATAQSVPRTTPAARVVTINFTSKLVNAALPYNVVLPASYDEKADAKDLYPVLYLLHGLTGHYSDWTSKTRLSDYANQYRLIIVTPEGNNGWYTDSMTVPSDKYETYIIEELIPDVERRFRADPNRRGRSIAGLSMGGYGALKFGIKHRDIFVFAASLSGALDIATVTEEKLRNALWIWKTLEPVYGPPGSPTRNSNDILKLYRELPPDQITKLPFLYIDCGTEDPLFGANRSFVEILISRKIPHEYRQLPGGHNWMYWDQQVRDVLRIAVDKMKTEPTTPSGRTN